MNRRKSRARTHIGEKSALFGRSNEKGTMEFSEGTEIHTLRQLANCERTILPLGLVGR